jgi:hypothetical protein
VKMGCGEEAGREGTGLFMNDLCDLMVRWLRDEGGVCGLGYGASERGANEVFMISDDTALGLTR